MNKAGLRAGSPSPRLWPLSPSHWPPEPSSARMPHPDMHTGFGQTSQGVLGPTYMVNEFLDHAVPLALVILCPVLAILHQPDLVGEAQDVGQFLEQVNAVALEPVIPKQGLVGLPEHDKGLLLQGQTSEEATRLSGSGRLTGARELGLEPLLLFFFLKPLDGLDE